MQLFYKLENGNKINYELKENNKIDMSIIIQKLVDLSTDMYHEKSDSIEASYKLDGIIDELIFDGKILVNTKD